MPSANIGRGLLAARGAVLFGFVASPVFGQQINGVPGSPSATTTIDGRYIPPLSAPFGGKIGLSASDSTPCWPPTGEIDKVTFKIGPVQLASTEQRLIQYALAKGKD
jgi:hypothetical protein